LITPRLRMDYAGSRGCCGYHLHPLPDFSVTRWLLHTYGRFYAYDSFLPRWLPFMPGSCHYAGLLRGHFFYPDAYHIPTFTHCITTHAVYFTATHLSTFLLLLPVRWTFRLLVVDFTPTRFTTQFSQFFFTTACGLHYAHVYGLLFTTAVLPAHGYSSPLPAGWFILPHVHGLYAGYAQHIYGCRGCLPCAAFPRTHLPPLRTHAFC